MIIHDDFFWQAEVPEWQGECEYTPENLFATTSFVCPEGHKNEVVCDIFIVPMTSDETMAQVQAFLASLEPLYKVQQDAHEVCSWVDENAGLCP